MTCIVQATPRAKPTPGRRILFDLLACNIHTYLFAGCFVLVSHINAQTEKGEEWLNTVVVAGLRKAGTEASWSMEVHGNAATVDDENQESAGPAVYLIFKGEPTTTTEEAKSGEPATIPLQFFCY